jgi:predicted nucleic acid-binding protein
VIVVDTSVWIAARRDDGIYDRLAALIDADEAVLALPVRLELLAGTPRKERKVFRDSCRSIAQIVPTEDTWDRVAGWVERATDAGQRFSMTDLLIAALADEIGGLVWSLDEAFARMEQLTFVSRYAW